MERVSRGEFRRGTATVAIVDDKNDGQYLSFDL